MVSLFKSYKHIEDMAISVILQQPYTINIRYALFIGNIWLHCTLISYILITILISRKLFLFNKYINCKKITLHPVFHYITYYFNNDKQPYKL